MSGATWSILPTAWYNFQGARARILLLLNQRMAEEEEDERALTDAPRQNPETTTVQEVVMNGEGVPERYRIKQDDLPPISCFPLLEIPVIDLSLLSTCAHEQDRLRSALAFCGCFQAVNHGMKAEFLDQVRDVAKQFFALPMAEKKKIWRDVGSIEGYGGDMILSENQTLDWTDRLYITLAPLNQQKLKFWPENPHSFRETINEYAEKLKPMTDLLLKIMARSLHLDENSFLQQYGEDPIMTARFNFYPSCPRPELVLGTKPHADGSVITILLQDKEVEGLQFLIDDQWVRASVIADALLVNIGDQIEIMSNGMFKSPVHRVLTNAERDRLSLAVFCIPNPDQEIGPVKDLINEERPRLYKTVKDFVSLYFQYYQQGKRPIEAALI